MRTTMKHWALAAAAAAALALAGCGGGGSSSGPTAIGGGGGTTPADPAPAAATTVAVADLMYLDADNMPKATAEGGMEIAAGESYTSRGVVYSCPATSDGCTLTIAADGTATGTGGVTAALTTAAMAQVDEAKKAAMAMTEEAHERALGVEYALRNPSTGKYTSAKITRGESGAAAISLKGWTSSASDPGAEGWAGAMLEGVGLLQKGQSMAVYSNIEAAKRVAFGTGSSPLYTETASENGNVAFVEASTQDDATAVDETKDHLSLTNGLTKAQAAYLDKRYFPQTGDKTATYGTGASDKAARAFRGIFRGASGMYHCTPAGTPAVCSVAAPAAGATTSTYTLVGAWTFTPGAGQKGVKMDDSHMNFGWWMKSPSKKNSGGDYVYDVEVFSKGTHDIADDANLTGLSGTANYMGPAAGLYVNKTGEGDSMAAMHGSFTATAELVANFDDDEISGEIGNFMGGSGMEDWSVKLGTADIASDSGSVSGKTSGTGTGTWSATFHGGTGSDRNAAAAYPAGVHGTFNAHSNTTNILGAFGADRQ